MKLSLPKTPLALLTFFLLAGCGGDGFKNKIVDPPQTVGFALTVTTPPFKGATTNMPESGIYTNQDSTLSAIFTLGNRQLIVTVPTADGTFSMGAGPFQASASYKDDIFKSARWTTKSKGSVTLVRVGSRLDLQLKDVSFDPNDTEETGSFVITGSGSATLPPIG